MGGASVGLYLLSEEDLPFHWAIAWLISVLSLFLAVFLYVAVLSRVQAENTVQGADFRAAKCGDAAITLRNAPWLPLPLAWLTALPFARAFIQPRMQSSSSALFLCSRFGMRVVPRRDIVKASVHAEGMIVCLVSGEQLSLETVRVPTSLLALVYAPLAQALLSARCRALSYNEALARKIAGSPSFNQSFHS